MANTFERNIESNSLGLLNKSMRSIDHRKKGNAKKH